MNDIWQGPSWASMEFGGRWKPLHYTIKRTYAPVISHLLKTSDDTLQLWFVNDERADVTVSYVVEPVSWNGAQISETQKVSNLSVRVPANSSFMAAEVAIGDLTGDVCDETTCFIKASAMAYKDDSTNVIANNLSNTYLFLSQMKDAQLAPNPVISTSNFVQVNDKIVRFNVSVS
jgi:beta-mannosidase